MTRFRFIPWTIFLIAIFFKILHWEGANMLLLTGTAALWIYTIAYLMVHLKTNFSVHLLNLVFTLAATFVMLSGLHWKGQNIVAGLAIMVTIALIYRSGLPLLSRN